MNLMKVKDVLEIAIKNAMAREEKQPRYWLEIEEEIDLMLEDYFILMKDDD